MNTFKTPKSGESLADYVLRIRKGLNLTQFELADAAGIHSRSVGKIVSFCNQKGGCGKTTAAVHFASWLHQKRKKVHFVDADNQGSGAIWMSVLGSQIPTERIVDANELIEKLPELASEFGVKTRYVQNLTRH
jgi:transcriptional regulator with XRE-family HTH domain